MPNPRRTTRTGAGLAVLALATSLVGCSTVDRATELVSPTPSASGSAAPGASASASATPSRPPTPKPTAPVAQPGTPLAQLALKPIWRDPVKDPAKLVRPGCERPSTVFVNTPMSPAGQVKPVTYPAAQRLKPGTNHSVQASAWAYPAAQVNKWLEHPETQPKGRKIAFLTFDDGPNGVTTPQIQAVLRKHHVPATFFIVGREITDAQAGLLRQSIADGNAIALHTYGHDYKYVYPHGHANPTNLTCDLAWARASVASVLGSGYQSHAMRYPGGHMSWKSMPPADAAIAKQGYSWIDWNSMSGDADATMPNGTATIEAANIHRFVTKGHPRRDVMVVLQHDYHPNVSAPGALDRIIPDLQKQGYTFGIID